LGTAIVRTWNFHVHHDAYVRINSYKATIFFIRPVRISSKSWLKKSLCLKDPAGQALQLANTQTRAAL
jgi:hypothetical protein